MSLNGLLIPTEEYILNSLHKLNKISIFVVSKKVIMNNVVNIASYIANRYQEDFGLPIDEMKLHKLLYFTQREAIIQTDSPLFEAPFYAWKYGPVVKEIRELYRYNLLNEIPSEEWVEQYKPIFDKVFSQYAIKDSWSLSRLSHGEYSWINARKGLASNECGDAVMNIEDIRQDAKRIKLRRYVIKNVLKQQQT